MKTNREVSTNRLILPALFIFFSLMLEVTTFLYLRIGQVFPSRWLLDVGFILIIAGLIFCVKKNWAMLTLFFVFILFQLIMDIINVNIYGVFGDIFTFDYFKLGREAKDAVAWEFIDFGAIGLYFGLFAVIVIAVVLLFKFNKKTITLKRMSPVAFTLVALLCFETCGVTMFACQTSSITHAQNNSIENNTSYLWDSFMFKLEAYRQFGFWGFYIKCVANEISGQSSLDESEKEDLLKFIDEGKTTTDQLDGRFANDNLFVILCESNEWFAYDPFNTPFIWDLMNGGTATGISPGATAFTNFHGHNKTNYSEGIVLTGAMPMSTTVQSLCSDKNYGFAYTLPKLFKQAHEGEDVQVNYFHTWERKFYERDPDYLSGYGFDEYYSIENFETDKRPKKFGDWVSDVEFVEQFADEMIPDASTGKKFMTSFATLSTHGPYDDSNPRFEEYYNTFDANFEQYSAWLEGFTDEVSIPTDKKEFERFRRYKSAAIDFNNTIQEIFTLLEERGHLNDTTVVMFADHNAYYSNLTYTIKNVEKTDFSNTKVHNVPLMIFNSKLEKGVIDSFCNTYDVYPTICELHGLTYNKNLVHGYNLFSDDISKSFFASHLGGMFDDNFFSKNIADVFPLVEEYTEEDVASFKEKAELFYQTQRKLEKIYQNNLAA